MAFNSNTYHANRYAREAWRYLRQARERRERGEDAECIGRSAFLARNSMHLSLGRRRMRELERPARG